MTFFEDLEKALDGVTDKYAAAIHPTHREYMKRMMHVLHNEPVPKTLAKRYTRNDQIRHDMLKATAASIFYLSGIMAAMSEGSRKIAHAKYDVGTMFEVHEGTITHYDALLRSESNILAGFELQPLAGKRTEGKPTHAPGR